MILHTIISAKWLDNKTVSSPNKMTQQKSSQKWEKNPQNGKTSKIFSPWFLSMLPVQPLWLLLRPHVVWVHLAFFSLQAKLTTQNLRVQENTNDSDLPNILSPFTSRVLEFAIDGDSM